MNLWKHWTIHVYYHNSSATKQKLHRPTKIALKNFDRKKRTIRSRARETLIQSYISRHKSTRLGCTVIFYIYVNLLCTQLWKWHRRRCPCLLSSSVWFNLYFVIIVNTKCTLSHASIPRIYLKIYNTGFSSLNVSIDGLKELPISSLSLRVGVNVDVNKVVTKGKESALQIV